jgi:flagellar basal-body rod protein FlgF
LEKILAAGALSLAAGQMGLEVTARNVSQGSVPGYRRQVFSVVAAELGPFGAVQSDLRPSTLIQSGSNSDLALDGLGYFQIELGGEVLLARGGQFARGAEGFLTGSNGQRLLDDSGQAIRVTTAAFQVMSDGLVTDEGLPVGRLSVVVPASTATIRGVGGTMLRASEITPADMSKVRVRQGALEQSNVESAVEMTAMMAALRVAEMGSRLIQTYDSLAGQAISTVGRGLR